MLVTILTASLLVFSVSASVENGSRYRIKRLVPYPDDGIYVGMSQWDNVYGEGDDTIYMVVFETSGEDVEVYAYEEYYDEGVLSESGEALYANYTQTFIGTTDELSECYLLYNCGEHSLDEYCEEGCNDYPLSDMNLDHIRIDSSDKSCFRIYVLEEDTPSKIGDLVTDMFSSFGDTVNGLTSGVKDMFTNILWNDGTTGSGLSGFAKFGFVMAGLSLTLGLGYVIISKIGR